MGETSYRDLSDTELAARYAVAGDAEMDAILAECARRDRKDEQTRRDAARWAAVYEEWFLFAHAQWLAAEAETCGYLLNKDGIRDGIDPWSLWAGPRARAERYMSEELRDFWLANKRITVTEWREQQRRAAREEAGAL